MTCSKKLRKTNLRDGMYSDFMTLSECFMNSRVIGVFVGNEEGGLDITTIWILTLAIEHFLVQFNIVVVDGIIESDCDHHRNILDRQISWNRGAIFRTEAIRQNASLQIAWRRSVWIVFSICSRN